MRRDPSFERGGHYHDDPRDRPGTVMRATGLAFDNPVAAGGMLVMLLTACLIVANAVSFQPGKHPAPLFSTRVEPVEPMPMAPQPSELVLDLQGALKRSGHYAGPVDGLNGPRTEEAIRAYEQSAGLAVTGRPSHALRARLILEDVALPRSAPAASTTGDETGSIAAIPPRPTVRAVQQVLADLGYGPITVDGLMGGETAGAVRRFELDRGMAIDGRLDERLYLALEKVSGTSIPR